MTDTTPDPTPADRVPPGDALRFAFGTLTVFPVELTRWDRAVARSGLLCAPLVGLVVGLCAGVTGAVLLLLGSGPLLAAVAAVAVPAALTRGLHLDGLADTADGLGSGKPAAQALLIMKRSDIGPFGVLTLVLTLLAQVAALSALYSDGPAKGALAAVLSALVGRTALTTACRAGVPAARPEGLGAAVAGVVPATAAAMVAVAVVTVGSAVGAFFGPYGELRGALAAVAGLGAADLLLAHCRQRFDGVTGDVFGAVLETAATASVVMLTLG